MNLRLLRLVALAAAMTVLSGCVSYEKYYALQQRCEATEAANVMLAEEVVLAEEELAQMNREQEEIAEELEALIVAGAIRMQMLESGLQLTLSNDVVFETGSATLSADGKDLLKTLSEELQDFPYQIIVIGHADNRPIATARYPSNWNLAADRAANVVNVLQAEGLEGQQLGALSLGDTMPVAGNETAEGRAANRRIEIRVRPVTSDDVGR